MKQSEIKRGRIYYIFIHERTDYNFSAHVYKVKCVTANSRNCMGGYPHNRFKVVSTIFGDEPCRPDGEEFNLLCIKEDVMLVYSAPEEPLRRARFRTEKTIRDYKKEIKRLERLL